MKGSSGIWNLEKSGEKFEMWSARSGELMTFMTLIRSKDATTGVPGGVPIVDFGDLGK